MPVLAAPYNVPDNMGTLLPAQWDALYVGHERPGHARLGAALIEEAWDTLRKYPQASVEWWAARRFFFGPPDPAVPMPLEFACALVGLHPDYLRRLVRRRLAR